MENILDINFDYYNISNKFKFNLQTKIKFDENSNNNNCENSYLFIGIDNMKELLFIKNFIGIKKFLFYDKSDIEIIKNPIMYKIFNDSDITNIYAYNDDLVILLNELGINAITINYKNNSIELKKNNFELEKYNKNILIVVDNKNSLGIYKHTQILNEELNATINYIDNNKIDICIFNNYDIIILQNTFIDLSYTNINNRKLIYVFHKNYSNFTQE